MRIRIFHRTDEDRFFSIGRAVAPTVEFTYEYEVDYVDADPKHNPPTADAWRANNRVDGSAVEVLPDTARSLSVGDIVTFDGFAWSVEPIGWTRRAAFDEPADDGWETVTMGVAT